MTWLSVYGENLIASQQSAIVSRLSTGQNCLDEDAESTARTVTAADDCEAERFAAGALLEGDGVKRAQRRLGTARHRAEVVAGGGCVVLLFLRHAEASHFVIVAQIVGDDVAAQ